MESLDFRAQVESHIIIGSHHGINVDHHIGVKGSILESYCYIQSNGPLR